MHTPTPEPDPRTGELARIVRTLQAQGYPIAWQSAHVGATLDYLTYMPDDDLISDDVALRIRALRQRLGDRLAQPGNGLTEEAITQARAEAGAAGWFPPAAYDDDGNLDLRALPHHAWAMIDDSCARRLQIAHDLVQGVWPRAQIAARAGVSRKTVSRARARVGRLVDGDPNWVPRLLTALAQWERCEVSATYAALHVGLIDEDSLPPEHPDLRAHRARVARRRMVGVA